MAPSTVYNVREGQKFAGESTLVVVSCSSCGITYAIPQGLDRAARRYHGDKRDGWRITCPLGHTWHYVGETEAERFERQLRNSREHAGRLAADLDQTKAEVVTHKRRATRFRNDRDRLKRRAAAGVCPCCNRSFEDLRRHMETKHPEFGGAS